MVLAHCRLTPDITCIFSGGGINCVSCDICVCTTFDLFVFFPWGILWLQSDWSLSCDDGFDCAS